jgi:hypothetical protein
VRIGSRSKLAETRALARASGRGNLGAEDVAGSPDGVQEAGLAFGLQLAAQVGDEHLDRVRGREGVIAPNLVEQALARDHDALVAHQVLEQLELALGQLDRALAADHLVRVRVQRQVADAQRRRAARRAPAQQRAHARQQLLALERLDQVVIGARIQPLHTRLQRVACGQDQDRHVIVGAQLARHLDAVELRQPEIEDHQVGREGVSLL